MDRTEGWFYEDGDGRRGPLDLSTLEMMKGAGVLTGETRITPAAGGSPRALDEVLQGVLAGDVTRADGAEEATASSPGCAVAGSPVAGYYVAGTDGQHAGPYTVAQLADMVAGGAVAPGTLVARDGDQQWGAVESVVGAGCAAAPTPAGVRHNDPVKVAVLSCLTLSLYWFCHVVPGYARDMAALTGRRGLPFGAALALGILGVVFPLSIAAPALLLFWMLDQEPLAGAIGAVGFGLLGLPSYVLACRYAFDLDAVGGANRSGGGEESFGWVFLGLVIAGCVVSFAALWWPLAAVPAVGIFAYRAFLLQREFNRLSAGATAARGGGAEQIPAAKRVGPPVAPVPPSAAIGQGRPMAALGAAMELLPTRMRPWAIWIVAGVPLMMLVLMIIAAMVVAGGRPMRERDDAGHGLGQFTNPQGRVCLACGGTGRGPEDMCLSCVGRGTKRTPSGYEMVCGECGGSGRSRPPCMYCVGGRTR